MVGRGVRIELELLRGELGGEEARRAAAIELTMVGRRPSDEVDAVVLDVPDVNTAASRFDPQRLLVIDDGDALASDAAVVVQPSQASWRGRGRADLVLAGYRFAPVGARYRRLRSQVAPAGPPPTRHAAHLEVLVCFGGSDPAGVTGRIAASLRPARSWRAVVAIGAGAAEPREDWPVDVVRDPGDLPERLAAADLAVLGAGTMKFEAASLGVPALLLAVADDQLAVGPPFAATGSALYLGDGRTVDPVVVRTALDALAEDPERRAAMSHAAWSTVDGDGAGRIADAALTLAKTDR